MIYTLSRTVWRWHVAEHSASDGRVRECD